MSQFGHYQPFRENNRASNSAKISEPHFPCRVQSHFAMMSQEPLPVFESSSSLLNIRERIRYPFRLGERLRIELQPQFFN